ncbi:hypothetical protein [Streptomyces sp. NPDC017868]|uniref:hypothetical protein n=1 Tax=Streptomyces sp. NPDC017868 TaxID=3365014 RepID=UPI0037BB8DBD
MPEIGKHIAKIRALYGRHQLTRTFNLPELGYWAWDVPRVGPGVDVLGAVIGLRILAPGGCARCAPTPSTTCGKPPLTT